MRKLKVDLCKKIICVACVVLMFFTSNLYGQSLGCDCLIKSPVFQIGDIVRYGVCDECNTRRKFLESPRKDVIRYLGADSIWLEYAEAHIHPRRRIDNRVFSARFSLQIQRHLGASSDMTREKNFGLFIDSGRQLMSMGERRFRQTLSRLPLDMLQHMLDSPDEFRFISHSYYVTSGRLEQGRELDLRGTIRVLSDSVSFDRGCLSSDTIFFDYRIPIAYGVTPITTNMLCKAIQAQNGTCILPRSWRRSFVPFGTKQINNDQKALGWTLRILQVGVPTAFGLYHGSSAITYRNRSRNTLTPTEQNYYRSLFTDHRNRAIGRTFGSFAFLYGINILVNYFFTTVTISPQTSNNDRGELTFGISINF